MASTGSLRSVYVVPALSERALENGLATEADAVMFDLAGGVPEGVKDEARELLGRFVSGLERVDGPLLMRVNGIHSDHMADDVRTTYSPLIDSYVIPGVENASGVEPLMGLLDTVSETGDELDVIPVVGTVEALDNTHEIAGAFGVNRLMLSRMDLINNLSGEWDEEGFATLYARSRFVMECCRADVEPPLDSGWPRLDDPEGLRRDAAMASRMGFQGKLVMAQNQIAVVNRAFTPDEKEVVQAQKIVDAFDNTSLGGDSPVTSDGFLVDQALYEHARQTLLDEGLL